MPRPPRFIDTTLHCHVIARFNNQSFYFEEEEDFADYLSILRLIQKKHHFILFNYEIMNSHVHLFLQPGPQVPLSKSMQLIHWKYSFQYNRRKKRKGHLWMDRYKCIPVESDSYALALMRYMNRNPVRAGMIEKAGDWKWSGYRFYSEGESNDLLTPHVAYLALSSTPAGRQKEYSLFVNSLLNEKDKRDAQFSEAPYIGSVKFGECLQKRGKK